MKKDIPGAANATCLVVLAQLLVLYAVVNQYTSTGLEESWDNMNFPLMIISELEQSEVIQTLVKKRMRAFIEPIDKSGAFIIITPVMPGTAEHPVSNNFLAERQHMQIDVQGTNYDDVNTLADEVRAVMFHEFNMTEERNGLETYFDETGRFLVSKNYIGIPQKLNYKSKII